MMIFARPRTWELKKMDVKARLKKFIACDFSLFFIISSFLKKKWSESR